jgi:hypothetical protein
METEAVSSRILSTEAAAYPFIVSSAGNLFTYWMQPDLSGKSLSRFKAAMDALSVSTGWITNEQVRWAAVLLSKKQNSKS